ncbi:MAG: tail fiber domain-containing protein, partial [Verrucomicrobiales bacterium]
LEANLKYSEKQAVTIANGEFSVLIGQGVANDHSMNGFDETIEGFRDLSAAFEGNCYLGVTVTELLLYGSTDKEISPRQQIVSTAFAFRADVANSLAASSVRENNMGDGSVNSAAIKNGSILGEDLQDGTVTYDKLKSSLTLHVQEEEVNKGVIGIGTINPTQAKLVVSGSVAGPGAGDDGFGVEGDNYVQKINSVGLVKAPVNSVSKFPTSIYATHAIWTGTALISSSDERIKNIQGRSDRAKDLETLLGIEVTDYRYKDVIGKGNAAQKKVIAQQVEKVYPQAVSSHTDVVPDVYRPARIKDDWIALATDLKPGDRVRLISKNEVGVHEVLETAEGKFRTAFTGTAEEVFVYGREVNDFLTVDYDAIAMLNVSATQELKKELDAEIQALRDENSTLRRELAAKDAGLEARLIALERRTLKVGTTETVSLRTDKVAE